MKGEISLQMPNAGPDSESEDHDDRDEVADHINERLTRSLMDCRVFGLFTESTRAQQLHHEKCTFRPVRPDAEGAQDVNSRL